MLCQPLPHHHYCQTAKRTFRCGNFIFAQLWIYQDWAKGLFKRFKKHQGAIDIDLACVLYDEHCTISDIVWFKQLRDKAESVKHQGDTLNGKDRGEQAMYL